MIRVSAFEWVPPFARGQVRDFRVRWALEEAGLAYETRVIDFTVQNTPEYQALQPFCQVPSYEEDGLELWESGAIVLHIAERSPALLPGDPAGRARAIAWIFSALNTLEPPIQNLAEIDLFHAEEDWAKARRPGAEEWVRKRLGQLAERLGDREWLEGDQFTAGDLMVSAVLRILMHTQILEDFPTLAAFRRRCEARPAFVAAVAAQMADFKDVA